MWWCLRVRWWSDTIETIVESRGVFWSNHTSVDWLRAIGRVRFAVRAQIFIAAATGLYRARVGVYARGAWMNERGADVTCFNGQCGPWVIPYERHTPYPPSKKNIPTSTDVTARLAGREETRFSIFIAFSVSRFVSRRVLSRPVHSHRLCAHSPKWGRFFASAYCRFVTLPFAQTDHLTRRAKNFT